MSVVEFSGVVKSCEKERIPKIYKVVVVSDDGSYRVEMDAHSDLVVYQPGERLHVVVSRELPSYREGEDFVGRGTVVSKRVSDSGLHETLISIGGLLFILAAREDPGLQPTEQVYVKVSRE